MTFVWMATLVTQLVSTLADQAGAESVPAVAILILMLLETATRKPLRGEGRISTITFSLLLFNIQV